MSIRVERYVDGVPAAIVFADASSTPVNRLPWPLPRAAPQGIAGRLLPMLVPLTEVATRPAALTEPEALMRTNPFVGAKLIRDVVIGAMVAVCGVTCPPPPALRTA